MTTPRFYSRGRPPSALEVLPEKPEVENDEREGPGDGGPDLQVSVEERAGRNMTERADRRADDHRTNDDGKLQPKPSHFGVRRLAAAFRRQLAAGGRGNP